MTIEEAKNVLEKYTDTDAGISETVAEAHELGAYALEYLSRSEAFKEYYTLSKGRKSAETERKYYSEKIVMTYIMKYPDVIWEVNKYIKWYMLENRTYMNTMKRMLIIGSDSLWNDSVELDTFEKIPCESYSENVNALTDSIIKIADKWIDKEISRMHPEDMNAYMKIMAFKSKIDRLKCGREMIRL